MDQDKDINGKNGKIQTECETCLIVTYNISCSVLANAPGDITDWPWGKLGEEDTGNLCTIFATFF